MLCTGGTLGAVFGAIIGHARGRDAGWREAVAFVKGGFK